jgi:hypothetical protein
VELLDTSPGVLAFRRGSRLVCVLNCGSRPAKLPDGVGPLVFASGGDESVVDGRLAANTAAWFTTE